MRELRAYAFWVLLIFVVGLYFGDIIYEQYRINHTPHP